MNHYSRELFETHSLDQVRSADLCRQPPVLERIKFAVSIEILERKSIHRQQWCGTVPDGWLLRFVSHCSGRADEQETETKNLSCIWGAPFPFPVANSIVLQPQATW